MKILFLSARYPPDVLGGGEISTRILAEALAAAGHAVAVLSGARADGRELLHGVDVYRQQSLQSWWAKPLLEEPVARRTAEVIQSFAATLQPDILHAHEFRSALALSIVRAPARVVTVRDFAPICGTTSNMWWDGSSCDGCFWPNVLFRCHRVAEASLLRKPFRVWQYKSNLGFRQRAYRRLPAHLYTSAVLRDRVLKRLSLPAAVRTEVIPNAIEPSWLLPPTPLPDALSICSVGRLETTKGTEVLLEAMRLARRTVPALHLHLAGSDEGDRYHALARRFGLERAVTFHGALPHDRVLELIDRSLAVVSPHRWEEPFGRAALEAGARARPLVASDLGGVRETTTPQTALLVPPGDAAVLVRAIVDLVRHPQRAAALGTAARAYVEQAYAPSVIAIRVENFYKLVLGPKRGS